MNLPGNHRGSTLSADGCSLQVTMERHKLQAAGRGKSAAARFAAYVLIPLIFVAGCHHAPKGTADLNWVSPATNTDGTHLADLSGYHIYYGQSALSLNHSVVIMNPATTHYTVTNLESGTWYFRVTAINSTGVESPMSGVATDTIP